MRTLFILLFLALATHGQQQERVAILNTVDDRDSIGVSSLSYLTDKLRETAVNVLPKSRYGIMTTESIVAFLGSQENARKICNESSCLAEVGRKVSADFVAQARIGRFEEQLSINFQLYSVKSGNLIGSFTGNSKDMPGLLAAAEEKAPVLFRQMFEEPKPAPKKEEPSPEGASDLDSILKRGRAREAGDGVNVAVNVAVNMPDAAKSANAAEAAKAAAESGSDAGKLGWRGWTRIVTFTAAAVCGTFAVVKHFNSAEYMDKFNEISKTKPETSGADYNAWYKKNYDDLKYNRDRSRSNAVYRNIYGTSAGIFAIAGTMTFFF